MAAQCARAAANLSFDDRFISQDDDVVIATAAVSKFGFQIATVTAFCLKQQAEAAYKISRVIKPLAASMIIALSLFGRAQVKSASQQIYCIQ